MNPTGFPPPVYSAAPPAYSAHSGTMSEACAGAIETLRADLKLNVLAGISLQDKLHRATGGFMESHEVQRVTSQSCDMNKMQVILDILLEKNDAAFHTFLAKLELANYGGWARQLRATAEELHQTAGQRPATVTPQVTSPAPATEQAGPSSGHQAELQRLLVDFQAVQAQLAEATQRLADQQVAIGQLQEIVTDREDTINTLDLKVWQKEQTIEKNDRELGQLTREVMALKEELAASRATNSQDLAIRQRDQTIENNDREIGQLRRELMALKQALAESRAAVQPSAPVASPRSEAGDLSFAVALSLLESLGHSRPLDIGDGLRDACIRYAGEIQLDETLHANMKSVLLQLEGCGTINTCWRLNIQGKGSPMDQVSSLLEALKGPLSAGDAAEACAIMTQLLSALNAHGCTESIELLLKGLRDIEKGDLPRRY